MNSTRKSIFTAVILSLTCVSVYAEQFDGSGAMSSPRQHQGMSGARQSDTMSQQTMNREMMREMTRAMRMLDDPTRQLNRILSQEMNREQVRTQAVVHAMTTLSENYKSLASHMANGEIDPQSLRAMETDMTRLRQNLNDFETAHTSASTSKITQRQAETMKQAMTQLQETSQTLAQIMEKQESIPPGRLQEMSRVLADAGEQLRQMTVAIEEGSLTADAERQMDQRHDQLRERVHQIESGFAEN